MCAVHCRFDQSQRAPNGIRDNFILHAVLALSKNHSPSQERTMTDSQPSTPAQRSIWLHALLMILMAMAFHLATMLLGLLAVLQFVLALVSDAPNTRLCAFGQSLGQYLRQIAGFVSFATEEVPFPFNDWP
jgi:hypothetical protein